MQKKICFVLTLTAVCFTESLPVNLGALEYDKLDADLSELGYEVEEEDLEDYAKLLDDGHEAAETSSNTNNKDSARAITNVKSSGFKKKNTENNSVKSKHSIDDLKRFFKIAGLHDRGAYEDADIYALAEAKGAAAVGSNGEESRTYKKGKKTRGFHRVHHKDEYKKDQEFYEDDEVKGTINKVGVKARGIKIGAGAGFNKSNFHHDRQKGIYGKQGYSDKGFLDSNYNGFSDSQGLEAYFANES